MTPLLDEYMTDSAELIPRDVRINLLADNAGSPARYNRAAHPGGAI